MSSFYIYSVQSAYRRHQLPPIHLLYCTTMFGHCTCVCVLAVESHLFTCISVIPGLRYVEASCTHLLSNHLSTTVPVFWSVWYEWLPLPAFFSSFSDFKGHPANLFDRIVAVVKIPTSFSSTSRSSVANQLSKYT